MHSIWKREGVCTTLRRDDKRTFDFSKPDRFRTTRRRPYNTTLRRRTDAPLFETGWRPYDTIF